MKKFLALIAAVVPTAALATVNVNTAQQSELQSIKGLDRVKAKSIIEWRAANGSIDNFAELQTVPGFTAELVEQLKPVIAFSGDPYVPPPKAAKAAPKKPAPANVASTNPSRRAPE